MSRRMRGTPSSSSVVGRVASLELGALGLSAIGVALLDARIREDGSLVFSSAVGLLLLAVAVVLWVGARGPDAERRTSWDTDPDGQPAMVVELTPVTPLSMIVLGGVGVLLSVLAVLAVGPTDGGLLFTPLVLLFALLLPDGLRAWRRRPRITMTAQTVSLRGWTLDSSLAWDDVVSISLEDEGTKYARIVFDGRLEASSWEHRQHKILVALDPTPSRPVVAVPARALDAPGRVQVFGEQMWAAGGTAARRGRLTQEGLAFVNATMRRP